MNIMLLTLESLAHFKVSIARIMKENEKDNGAIKWEDDVGTEAKHTEITCYMEVYFKVIVA